MKRNESLRAELIAAGLITPAVVVTPAYLASKGYHFAAAAMADRLSFRGR